MKRAWKQIATLSLLTALFSLAGCQKRTERSLSVFAAISLRPALLEIIGETEEITFHWGSSGLLSSQLQTSPRAADVFLSADSHWIEKLRDALPEKQLKTVQFARNPLVLAHCVDAPHRTQNWLSNTGPLLLVGDPETVPLGALTKEWLSNSKNPPSSEALWQQLEKRLTLLPSAEMVVQYLRRTPSAVAFIYQSDLTRFPSELRAIPLNPRLATTQTAATYTGAILERTKDPAMAQRALRFFETLQSPGAQKTFETQGFEPIGRSAKPDPQQASE